MDLSAFGGLGLGGALVAVIGYLLWSNWRDRAQHQQAISRLLRQQKAEREEWRRERTALERRVADLEATHEAERRKRFDAEERAAVAERDLRLLRGTG